MPEEANRSLSYREIAPKLADYVTDRGFTHVEFLPIMEHPFYGSWGYQTTGYFRADEPLWQAAGFDVPDRSPAPAGIGVILDWVPSHFPEDEHGLKYFDGTHLYEHADPRQGISSGLEERDLQLWPQRGARFLLSSAIFWLDKYHVDGLRVDAVASMLYLDYGRKDGEWIPNEYGGKENVEAIQFLRQMNRRVYTDFPDVQTIAEESTSLADGLPTDPYRRPRLRLQMGHGVDE